MIPTPTTPTPTPVHPPVRPPTPVPPPVPPAPIPPPAPVPASVPTPELPKEPVVAEVEPVDNPVILSMMLIYAVAAFTYSLAFKKAVADIQSTPDGKGLFLFSSITNAPMQIDNSQNTTSGMAGLKMLKAAAAAAVASSAEIDLALNIPTEMTPEMAAQGLTELDEDLPNEEESPD